VKRLLLVILSAALACSGGPKKVAPPVDPMPPEEPAATDETEPEPEPALPALEQITITVVAAEIEPNMKDGRAWDGSESRLARSVSKPLLQYMEQHPELHASADTLGIPIDAPTLAKDAQKDAAPDPMVFVEVGALMFRTPVRPRAFAPLWDFALTFGFGFGQQHMGVVPGSLVRIHVVDYDGPTKADHLGTTLMSIEQLLAKPVHRLGPFGSVTSLTLQVKRTPIDETAVAKAMRLAVPGKPSWTDSSIEVTAGQHLVLEAADEVCTTQEELDKCSGPEGQAATSDKKLPGFPSLGHGALVGAIGDVRFAVGRRLELVAPSSGVVRLGVNDRHYVNNRGSYAVRVTMLPLPDGVVPRPAQP